MAGAANSEATRLLLCDFAAADIERPLHCVDANWKEVFQGVYDNRLLGLTERYLEHHRSQDYPPIQFRQRVHRAHRTMVARMMWMHGHMAGLLTRLSASGLEYMVLKGPALAHLIYPAPMLRAFGDLDLIVRERDWAAMHRFMLEAGFSADRNLPHPPPKLIPQDRIEHQRYWHSAQEWLVEVHYDDFLHAGLASRDVEGFWRRAIQVPVCGVPVKVLCLEDQLVQLCAHAHAHKYERLGWLSDIALIVRDHGSQLDWSRVLQTVRIEEAQVGVYYSLCFLERLLGVQVPQDMLLALRPDPLRRFAHERLMPKDQVLSLQPLPNFVFSFYFRPVFRRMLPDLAVMGRRPEKLHYLFRLFLSPPRDWLMHHYSLDASSNILAYRILHPLRFLRLMLRSALKS